MNIQRGMEWLRAQLRVYDERPPFILPPVIQAVANADVEWPQELTFYQQSVTPINGDTVVFWGPGSTTVGQPPATKAWRPVLMFISLAVPRVVDILFDFMGSNNFTLPIYSGSSSGVHAPYQVGAGVTGDTPTNLWLTIFAPHRIQIIVRSSLIADGNFTIKGLFWERDINQKLI